MTILLIFGSGSFVPHTGATEIIADLDVLCIEANNPVIPPTSNIENTIIECDITITIIIELQTISILCKINTNLILIDLENIHIECNKLNIDSISDIKTIVIECVLFPTVIDINLSSIQILCDKNEV